MPKYFVLDTNVLLHNAEALESFADNTVILPLAVLEELDRFKTRTDELGRNARRVIRRLDELRRSGNLRDGVPLSSGGKVRVIMGGENLPLADLNLAEADNRILGVAWRLHAAGERVIFVSKDINARLKADALGLEVMDFEKQKVDFDEIYTGYREIAVGAAIVDEIHRSEQVAVPLEVDLYPNEFIVLRDEANAKHSALGRAAGKRAVARLCPRFELAWGIKPRNKEQRMALEILLDPAVQIVTLVGQAGTGKTLLALAAALEVTQRQRHYDKILVTRPVIPMGKDIGYLPGAKDEKLSHWMQPIFDNLAYLLRDGKGETEEAGRAAHKRVDEMMRNGLLEMEALTYIRGRSIPRQYVIVDEAQNLTPHEVKTIISRAGDGTKMVLCGDPYQIDNPYLDADSNGLTYAVERLKAHVIHGHVMLKKSERSVLAALAAEYL
ncbi:MAG: PhoH family protein [Planctomycetota bacterium]|nr:PhoH family protein [Planctomycetota bacterium]